MLKRVMIIGALIPCLVSMVGTTVAVALSIGGISVIGINSVEVESILKQLQNTAITNPRYEVVMVLQKVSATCLNAAGQTGDANNGRPFSVDNVEVSEAESINSSKITKNGKYLSEIIFTDADLAAALAGVRGGCNQNWTMDKIVVHEMQVFGTLFSCTAAGSCTIEDALGKHCFAPVGVDLFNATFEYECDTI
jgi:hypothetical protein